MKTKANIRRLINPCHIEHQDRPRKQKKTMVKSIACKSKYNEYSTLKVVEFSVDLFIFTLQIFSGEQLDSLSLYTQLPFTLHPSLQIRTRSVTRTRIEIKEYFSIRVTKTQNNQKLEPNQEKKE